MSGATRAAGEPPGIDAPVWRALAVVRVVALAYATTIYAMSYDERLRPALGVAVLVALAAWTAFTAVAYRPDRAPLPLLVADLAVACAAVLATRLVDSAARIESGAQTLPVLWPAAVVLAWAVARGARGGAAAAAAVGVADLVERGAAAPETLHNIVLLVLLGTVVGWAVTRMRVGEERLAAALRREAAVRERERLARGIHDGVLQVLALVQRRGAEIGGPAAELGRLAGEQEAALRALVSRAAPEVPAGDGPDGQRDVRELLARHDGAGVVLSAPASPVLLPAVDAAELAAAVAAALDNVARHAGDGARAWVLVEDDADAVVVSVRDDGVGMAAGRLEEAAGEGRLGVAQSIRARVVELGGRVEVVSAPGAGTEVELVVPRKVRA